MDLLGFTALVQSDTVPQIIPLYFEALGHLEERAKQKAGQGLIHSWFSDTFIIYSRDDSDREFTLVEQVGRLFFQTLILKGVAVRGALTHGLLYSQSSKNVFVGPALIDAYHYGEKQDWLGFLLTPAVSAKLVNTDLSPARRAHYRLVERDGIILHKPSAPVYAFAFNNATLNGKNPYVGALQKMRERAPESAKAKYDRSVAFAEQHDHLSKLE